MKTGMQCILYCAVFLTALQLVVVRYDARRLFIELQALEHTRDELNEEWGRLQLEQNTWAMDDQIESIAKNKLDMKIPDHSVFILIE